MILAAEGRATGGGLTALAAVAHLGAMTMVLKDATPSARSWKQAMWRGFTRRCPACGRGPMFRSYLKVNETCAHCGEELHHQRADDGPAYFTMMIVGHIVVPSMLVVEILWHPPLMVHFLLWMTLAILLTYLLLPSVKGAVVGLQWALRMHGFDLAAARQDNG